MSSHYKEHIYSLEERNESDISPLWQVLQILFFTCCVVFGFTTCFVFGQAVLVMQYNCMLHARVSFCDETIKKNATCEDTTNIRGVGSDFESYYCDFVIYTSIVVSTVASFFAVMFAYCGRGGAGNKNVQDSWRIVLPTIIFNFVGLTLSALTVKIFYSGLKEFLKGIAAARGKTKLHLEEISNLKLDGKNVGFTLITYLSLTKHSLWLLISFWVLNFLWILLRCLFNVDFQLVRTTIHVYPKKQNVLREKMRGSDDSFSETESEKLVSSELYGSPKHSQVKLKAVQFSPSTNLLPPKSKRDEPKRSLLPPPQEEEVLVTTESPLEKVANKNEETEISNFNYEKKETENSPDQ